MKNVTRRFGLAVAILGLLIAISGQAKAGLVLPTHGFVGATTLYGEHDILPGSTVQIEGNGALSAGLIEDLAGGPSFGVPRYSGKAFASVSDRADQLFKVSSAAYGERAHLFSPIGEAQALASWRDVAFTTLPILPAILRLTFQVTGTLDVKKLVNDSFVENIALFGVSTTTNPLTFFNASQSGTTFNDFYPIQAMLRVGITGLTTFTSRGPWDSLDFNGISFAGTFHIDTPYRANLGGYGWGVAVSSRAYAAGGTADSNFQNTVTLRSVALADGTPVDVTFDSGLRVSAVPEPSSIALVFTALPMGLGLAWKRRRKAVSAATA